jgi:CheY-like chemotaxis protein
MKPESIVQRAVIKRLNALGYVAASVPNGSVLAGDRLARVRQMASMKADGLMVGFPDLIVIGKGRVGFMEVKTPEGKISPAQNMVRKILEDKGQPWACVRSQDEVVDALKQWGWQ